MSVSLNILISIKKNIIEKTAMVIEECCKLVLPNLKTNVVLTVCEDDYIKMLNGKYRSKYNATDVLSFPLLESKCAGEINYSSLDIDPETQEIMLGDIIISFDKVKAQAMEYEHSIEREICYLVIHSILHLIGYNHIDDDEKKIMRTKEDEILKNLEISR